MAGFGGHATPARVTDLRGRVSAGPISPVLVDPTGRRARQLRVVGRMLASVLLLWLCGLVLGGVGMLPLPGVPLGAGLRVAQEPAAIPSRGHDPSAPALGPALPPKVPSALVHAVRVGTAHLTAVTGHGHLASGASQVTGGAHDGRQHGSGRGGGGAGGQPSSSGSRSVTSSSSSSSTSTSSTSSNNASATGAAHGRSSQAHSGTTANSHGSTQGTSSSGSPHGNGQHRALGHGATGG